MGQFGAGDGAGGHILGVQEHQVAAVLPGAVNHAQNVAIAFLRIR